MNIYIYKIFDLNTSGYFSDVYFNTEDVARAFYSAIKQYPNIEIHKLFLTQIVDLEATEEEETKEGFDSATTKPNPTAMPGYGSWEQKFQRLSSEDMGYVPPGSGNNPLKKESVEVKESAPVVDTATANLFKAYEAFKNGQ